MEAVQIHHAAGIIGSPAVGAFIMKFVIHDTHNVFSNPVRSLNSSISGIKFFFNITLDRPELVAKLQPVHLPRKLPVILSPEEVKRLIAAASSLKHQTALFG